MATTMDRTHPGTAESPPSSAESPAPYPLTGDGGFCYEIRIRDHLETYWHSWFEGWQLTNLAGGEVLLHRWNADQSALHGVLTKIRDLNLTLLSVQRVR
jgi:hypothetical protein